MIDLSVVIPAYNEADVLGATLDDALAWLGDSGLRHEVIVVDDGSADDTYAVAQAAARQHGAVRPARLARNAGKGFALKFGVAYATGEQIAFLDADRDIRPDQLGVLWESMQQSGADAVVGSKRHPSSEISYPLSRRVMSLGYYLLMRLMFGLPLRDTQTGIKLFRRAVLIDILPRLLIKRFAFDLELLACAHRLGYRVSEAPVVVAFQRGGSRITWRDVRTVGVDTLAVFYRLRLLRYYDDVRRS
jgi:glycosyltransferase involved in cell wall biosynthesis